MKQSLSLSRFGGWQHIEIPCCKGCGWRLDFGRVLRGARFVLFVAAVAIPATWLLYHYTPLRDAALGGTVFGIICVVALVNAFWEMFHPPEFAIDVTGSKASFEFRDRARAEEFAAANGMRFGPPPPNGTTPNTGGVTTDEIPDLFSDTEEGFSDLMFRITEWERTPEGGLSATAKAFADGQSVGVRIVIGADWKPATLGDNIPVFWGTVSYLSLPINPLTDHRYSKNHFFDFHAAVDDFKKGFFCRLYAV